MMHDHETACPRCGLLLPSLAEYDRHWEREHWVGAGAGTASQPSDRLSRPARPSRPADATYRSGCPILPTDGYEELIWQVTPTRSK